MTKKQIKSEFPNEVDILRTTLAEVKVKLPGLDTFLLANPDCTKCSNSKDYHCVQLKGKPGCRTCTTRRISCSRHVQYLVETAASRLGWSVEKTKSMYDKHVKQTRTGRKSLAKVKKIPIRKAMDTVGSGSAVDQTVVAGKGGKRNVAAPDEDGGCEGDGGSDYQDGAQQAPDDLENFSDDPEEDDDQDTEWNENTPISYAPHSISNATPQTSPSKPDTLTLDEIPAFNVPVLESEEAASLGSGLHDSTSLPTDSEKTDTMPRLVVDLTQRDEDGIVTGVPDTQSEDAPESSMSAEQRIKQLEDKVAKLNALRVFDAASISRLTKRANTAFDNMSVLLRRVQMHRQELGTAVTTHLETTHQKPFQSLMDKMDETAVSGTQILMLLDKRKNYVMPKTRVPVVIVDEGGEEWVPWHVISDDDVLRDVEMEKKRRGDINGTGEGSSKRRKC